MTSAPGERMVELILRSLIILIIASASLPGCAYMTKSGRQQLAMQRYIRKCSGKRVKIVKVQATQMPPKSTTSDYHVNSGTSDGPQSVSSAESQSGQ